MPRKQGDGPVWFKRVVAELRDEAHIRALTAISKSPTEALRKLIEFWINAHKEEPTV